MGTAESRSRQREEAYAQGAIDTALAFTELIDDCDRAILALSAIGADESIRVGLEGARDRMLDRLVKHDLVSLFPVEEQFDPLFHEAIAVEPSQDRDGVVTRVHRRGWLKGDKLLRPAMVTVCQGAPVEEHDAPTDHVETPEAAIAVQPTTHSVPRRRGSGGSIPGFSEDRR